MKFCLATHNKHKVIEFKRILEPLGIEIVTPNIPDVEETGSTFLENAILKAKSAYVATGLPSIADDSGLSVDFLNGAPGIYSARFSGEDGNDQKNIEKLLNLMEDVPEEKRGARFICTIALADQNGIISAEGTCEGRIATEAKGSNGFGYDPVFISKIGCFGELPSGKKDSISHRAVALQNFINKLKETGYVNK